MLKDHVFSDDIPIKVSVAMIAFNVEKYMEAAVESVLSQEVNFRVELVIGEDCSTDNTRQIALDFQQKYPTLIRVLTPDKNQGLTPNCVATIDACKGEYVALLDGDDYWTDDSKLQLQIDFLDKNQNFSGSCHQSTKIYDDNSVEDALFGSPFDATFQLLDTLSHRKFHTSSFVFRRTIWMRSGGIPTSISSNERAIYPMVAIFGPIQYLGQSMCVYRFSGFGLSSRVDYRELATDLDMLPWLKRIEPTFPVYRFKSFLHLCIYTYGTKGIPFFPLMKHYVSFLFCSFSYFPNNLGDIKWGTRFFVQKILKK